MLRWVFIGLLLSTSAPAAAEDWRYVAAFGDTPTREASVLDADSIDRTNPAIPTVTWALWKETPDHNGAVSIAKVAIDCGARTLAFVHIELRDSEGGVLAAESPEDEPLQAILDDTPFGLIRGAVCEGQWEWPGAFQFGEGRTLHEIGGEVFKG